MGKTEEEKRRWKLNRFSLIPAILAFIGMLVLTYPTAASWISLYNQSKVVESYENEVDNAQPDRATQLQRAREYNEALKSGAVLPASTNVPHGTGVSSNENLDYSSILKANEEGLMARIKIPSIDLDLPVYHGTSDETLLKGIGHLEGTSLPVGGVGQRTVLTGHRGLADATMFTNLNKVKMEDTFTIETFGEVLTYKVTDIKVVEPEDTEALRFDPNKDLATLVTCTPLGINTHRILVTGERVIPTPQKDLDSAGAKPEVPFPWWIVWLICGTILICLYVWWEGLPKKKKKKDDDEEVASEGVSAE